MKWFYLYVKGLLIGCADLVPGVSGSTLALLLGIYGRILEILYACDRSALKMLLRGEIRALFLRLQGRFILVLGAGMMTSLFGLAKVIRFIKTNEPVLFWSFFLGLMMAVIYVVARAVPWRRSRRGMIFSLLILGLMVGLWVSLQLPGLSNGSENMWMLFISGGLAVSAMLLPGISGSFVLLWLGKYELLIEALDNFEWDLLFVFSLGGWMGLWIFWRFISLLWRRYAAYVLAVVMGLMLGGLPRFWPWQKEGRWYEPSVYALEIETAPEIWAVVLSIASGVGLVLVFAPKDLQTEDQALKKDDSVRVSS